MKVYLCGPINGCTDDECKVWRNKAKEVLADTIDPMRRDYRGREDECVREIVEEDKKDVVRSDVFLAFCPKPSVGTSMEILFAWELGKRIAVVVPDGAPISPWLRYHSSKIFNNFNDAYVWINSL